MKTTSTEMPCAGTGFAGRTGSAGGMKLPQGWETCRTGIKGVRKWRNMTTQCWVTQHADDTEALHCGIRGNAVKIDRTLSSAQQAVDSIHAMTLPNDPVRDAHGTQSS